MPCGWDLKVECPIKNAIPVCILATFSTQSKSWSLNPTSCMSKASISWILLTLVKHIISHSCSTDAILQSKSNCAIQLKTRSAHQKECEYKVQTVTGTSQKHCVMVKQTACLGVWLGISCGFHFINSFLAQLSAVLLVITTYSMIVVGIGTGVSIVDKKLTSSSVPI